MLSMLHNGTTKLVKAMLIEFEDGEVLEFGAAVTPPTTPVVVEATPDTPVAEAKAKEPKVKKPRKKREPKAETPKPEPQAFVSPAVVTPQKQQLADERWNFQVPISQCVGHCYYEVRAGKSKTKVLCAIHRTGRRKDDGQRWYRLLYISKDNKFAGSSYGGDFPTNKDKVSGVEWWNGEPS